MKIEKEEIRISFIHNIDIQILNQLLVDHQIVMFIAASGISAALRWKHSYIR